jgi:hypothetical protein
MADRYWVAGGTGNYNSTTNWSATSGGASGASVPTTVDDVFFNASSGAGIATINATSNCRSLNLTGFTGTLNFNFNLNVNGTILNLGTGGYTITGTANLRLATTMTITSNGTIYQGNFEFSSGGTYTLADDLTINGTTIISSSGAQNLNGNNLFVKSNFLITSSGSGSTSGTTNIILSGTGIWSTTQSNTNTGQILCNLIIDTLGTITISGKVFKGGGTFTYTSGTIVDTGATIVIGRATTTTVDISGYTFEKILIAGEINLSSDINATTFGTTDIGLTTAPSFTLNSFFLNFVNLELGHTGILNLPTSWVCQDILLNPTSSMTLNNNSITINGNISQENNGFSTGTTIITYAGTGSWQVLGGVGRIINSFTINTAGTLTFLSAGIGGGVFTYTAGTVITAGSTLFIRTTNTTMNHGSIVWHDVVLGNALNLGGVGTLVLNNQLVCLNSLIFGVSNTAFSGADGTFDTYDLYFGSSNSATNVTLFSAKTYTVRRLIIADQAPSTAPINLRSSSVGTRAIFTLLQGSNINIGFLNATDIDSSLGRTIYSYRGVFTNTLNWQLLPTDVTPKTSIFVS